MPSSSSFLRRRILPWWLLYELASAAGTQWRELDEADRARLTELMRKSRGWPLNLTPSEREEVARIARKIDLKRAVRDVVPRVVGRGR